MSIQPQRIIFLGEDIVPSNESSGEGEARALFLTEEEGNFLSRLLRVHGMRNNFDGVLCQKLLGQLGGQS